MTASVKVFKTPTLILGSVAMSLWTVTIAAIVYYGFDYLGHGSLVAALLLLGINFAYNYVTARILLLLTKHSFPTEEDQQKVRGHVARLVCFMLVNLAVWVTTTARFGEYYENEEWNNTPAGKSLLCLFLAGFTFLLAIAVAVPAGLISNEKISDPRVQAYDNPAMRGSQSYPRDQYPPPPARGHPARPW